MVNSDTKPLRAALLNVHSVRNKCHILRDLILNNHVDIFCFTETWLREGTENSTIAAFLPDTHNFHSFHRSDNKGGGVGIALGKSFRCRKTSRPYKTFECIEVCVSSGKANFLIYTIYRPPGYVSSDFLCEFTSFLLDSESANNPVIYAGDFNIWLDVADDPGTEKFTDILNMFDLRNFVTESTYNSGHILDLVISRCHLGMVDEVNVCPMFTVSDHKLIEFKINIEKVEKSDKL